MSSFNSQWLKSVIVGKPQESFGPVYRNLLNLLDDAAVLIDLETSEIIYGNSEFSKLTAFSLTEVPRLSLSILTDLNEIKKSTPGEDFRVILKRRNQTEITVWVTKYLLDEKGFFAVLVIVPEQIYLERQDVWQDKIFFTMQKLLRLIEKDSLNQAFQAAVQIIAEFFNTSNVIIYQAKSEFPALEKSFESEADDIFPDEIPSSDVDLDAITSIWTPGHRVISKLHRAARMANFAYVAMTAMGPGNSASALLVVGHAQNQPIRFMREILEVFGSTLSAILQYFILVTTLRQQLDHYDKLIVVQEQVFSNSFEGVLVLHPDYHIWYMNTSAELLLGYQNKEAIGQPIDHFIVSKDNLSPILDFSKNELMPQNLGMVKIHRRNGDPLPVEIRVQPVTHQKKIIALLIFLRDVSEIEEYRQRVEQLEQHAKLGEITAVFAHDVRNPINNISMGLQILTRKLSGDEQSKELTDRMLQDCDRLTHLMESVLAYSKPFDPKIEDIDIGFLVERVVSRLKTKMFKHQIKEFIQKPEKIPLISADARSLEQVFTNLISNAIEAMVPLGSGTLAIHIELSEMIANHPQVVVKVIDSGPGIPEEIRNDVFEPFVTTKKNGTGLGLAICKRIITAHRGNITVTSFPGGTVFSVFLPTKQGDQKDGHNNSDR